MKEIIINHDKNEAAIQAGSSMRSVVKICTAWAVIRNSKIVSQEILSGDEYRQKFVVEAV